MTSSSPHKILALAAANLLAIMTLACGSSSSPPADADTDSSLPADARSLEGERCGECGEYANVDGTVRCIATVHYPCPDDRPLCGGNGSCNPPGCGFGCTQEQKCTGDGCADCPEGMRNCDGADICECGGTCSGAACVCPDEASPCIDFRSAALCPGTSGLPSTSTVCECTASGWRNCTPL